MDINFLISQILGFIALIICAIGYFVKSKPKFLIMQTIANVFYAMSFLWLGVLSAGIITIISTFRCVFIFYSEKFNFKHTIYYLTIFIVLYIITTIFTWESALDIIPVISGTIFTYAYYIKNLKLMRYLLLIPNTILSIFSFCSQTFTNAMLDGLEVIVIIVSIINNEIQDKKNKKQNIEVVKRPVEDKDKKHIK